MSKFAESSFLFALYFSNENTSRALEFGANLEEQIILSPLVAFEFQQAVWLEVFRFEHGDPKGLPRDRAFSGLAAFEIDLDTGRLKIAFTDLRALLTEAVRLSGEYTVRHGIRSMDILHLAAARLLGCSEFLSFDLLQRHVAKLEGFAFPV